MMIQAVLSNPSHPEYGVATIPFPIPRDQYAHCMELLAALEIGDAVKADCKVEEVDSFYTVLKRVEMLTVNVEELNYLAKRLDSFDTGEAAQFQAMAHKLELFELKDLMNLHGGSASVDELNALDGKGTARQLTESGKVIELPSQRFQQFSRALLADYDFIAENKNSIRHNDDARHCLLILDAEGKDGFLVDPQGYNYARYSAFVPNARSLLTPDMGIDRSYLSPAEPWRNENRDEILRMTLRVEGKPDYTLVLPADEEYLDAVKAYLDIDVFADAMLCDIRFKVPYIGELIRDTDCPAVEDYNDFAEALEDIWQKDGMLLTYAAVLEAEKPETLHRACELLQDLDNYQRVTEGAYGYGQQRLQETLGLDDEAIYELEGYMDFEKYGQDCMENDCVMQTEFGLLRRLEPPFPEQTQGQQMFR